MAATPAVRRYVRRLSMVMAAYGVILVLGPSIVHSAGAAGSLWYSLSFLPALPLLGVLAVVGLYLKEEEDEFIRMTAVKALLAATGFLLCVSTIWGFLELSGTAPHAPAYLAMPVWAVGLLFANLWCRWPE